MPVPTVSSTITPPLSVPDPTLASASPAASASLSTVTDWPSSAVPITSVALVPIHDLSTFAAVRITPLVTTPGYATQSGFVQQNSLTTAAMVLANASGVAGCGVGSL